MKHIKIIGVAAIAVTLITVAFSNGHPENALVDDVSDSYFKASLDQGDWNSCVQKAESKWGGDCLNYGFSEMKYSVWLVNTCQDKIDLMSCVQRENDRWQCFYRMDMTQHDTLVAYACRGNGKYLKWVRQAGDILTKFPTMAEVNEQY